jgi:two-component system response regulator NreC
VKQKRLTRIVIAENHVLMRELIVRLIGESSTAFQIVAEEANAREAIRACLRHGAHLFLFRLALLGDEDQIALTGVKKKMPDLRVMGYAGPAASDERIMRAMRNGVDGFIGKTNRIPEFLTAIDRVRNGDNYFPPETTHLLAKTAAGIQTSDEGTRSLSPRENEVLRMIANGHTSKQIAQLLGLSVATIDTHRRNLMIKIGARNAADLIRYGHRHDLLTSNGSA